LFPCIASATTHTFAKSFTTLSAQRFVRVKTNIALIFSSTNISAKRCFLFQLFTKNTDCLTVSAVEETGVISILIGLFKILSANPDIIFGIVAEKNRVCLLLGSFVSTFLTSLINHISNILSASSNVNISTFLKSTNH
jgi:hypothetical protein